MAARDFGRPREIFSVNCEQAGSLGGGFERLFGSVFGLVVFR